MTRTTSAARAWVLALIVAVVSATALLAVPAGTAGAAASGTCPDPSGTVKVGLSYFGGVEQNLGDIGAEEASSLTPATRAILDNYRAGIANLNANGGLAGCQVEPEIFNFSAQSADFNQTSQQECTAFTQDSEVVAVFATAYETKVAVDCLAKAKVPMFQFGGNYPPTCVDEKKYAGYIYNIDGMATCRFNSFIGIWDKAGLFPADAKVGILVHDDGTGQAKTLADKIWTPQLKKMKIPVETFAYPAATSGSTFADTNAALANGILKFKADGVNVVLFTPAGGQGPAAWLPQAANQNYFPNYGLDTVDGLGIAGSLGGAAIKKGIAISWVVSDLPLAAQQALPTNPAITKCAAWTAPSTTSVTGTSGYCDFLTILQAGFKDATKVDGAALKKGIEALGTSFKSSVTYGGATKFAKGRYNGVDQVQVLTFDPATRTWNMASPTQKAITVP